MLLAQTLPRPESVSEELGEREAGERVEGVGTRSDSCKVVTRGGANEG